MTFILKLFYNLLSVSELYLISDEKRSDITYILSIISKAHIRNIFNFLVSVNERIGFNYLNELKKCYFSR